MGDERHVLLECTLTHYRRLSGPEHVHSSQLSGQVHWTLYMRSFFNMGPEGVRPVKQGAGF